MKPWLFAIILALASCQALAGPEVLPNASPHKSLGTVNCASSTCHGSVSPWADSMVLHNEYTTWSRLDKHAHAYDVLHGEQSRAIAAKLGINGGAAKSPLCLDCHTHNPAPSLRGERFQLSDGVSCEACHGPSEKWIASHTVAGTLHADNVARGLYPTARPSAQARLCLSCHLGDESRSVSHRLMGAGHPRMSFELDTFAQLAPVHYKIDADWRQRKGDYDSVRLWAVSQAVASQNLLKALSDPKRGRDGLFPELALFDCHACHRPMSDKKWSPRLGIGPGRARLNDSNLLMLRAIVRAVDPAAAPAFAQQVSQLHQAVSGNREAGGADPLALAATLAATIERYITRFEQQSFGPAVQRAVLAALVDEARSGQFADYAGAEQAYLSISSLSSALVREGALARADAVNRQLVALRALLAKEDSFRPDAFAAQLLVLSSTLSNQAK